MKNKPPIDIHEYTVEKHAARKPTGELIPDPIIVSLASAVRDTRVASEQLAAYEDALSNDISMTPNARAIKLRDNALKVAEATARKLEVALNAAQTEIGAVSGRTSAPQQPKDQLSAGIEAEVRARLAAMDDKSRTDTIGTAFEAKDLTVVAAVLRGPAMLVGLDKTRQDMVRLRYQQEWHPEEHARLGRLTGAVDAFQRSGQSFIGFIRKLTTNPTIAIAEAAATNVKNAEQAVLAHIKE